MELQPNAELCSTCHKSTTDEWRASKHAGAGVQCQNCHNPHSQTPKAATITELCANCHKERGASYTHGTHSSAGLECSNCHMYRAPRTQDPIQGLVPTGHTFFVGSDACIGCHQDTVHTRDQILKLSGEVAEVETTDIDTLKKQLSEQEEKITSLQSQSAVRVYTGLIQGAIIGLITGAVAAWVVSQRVRFIEVENE
jgi:predicted CXXCH cytochrome family protein